MRQRRLWWLTVFPRLGNLTRRTAATFSSPPGDGSARRQSACLDRFSGAVSSLSRPKGGTRVRRSPTRSTIVCWFAADLFMRRGERNAPPPRLPWPQMRPEHTCAVQHAQRELYCRWSCRWPSGVVSSGRHVAFITDVVSDPYHNKTTILATQRGQRISTSRTSRDHNPLAPPTLV